MTVAHYAVKMRRPPGITALGGQARGSHSEKTRAWLLEISRGLAAYVITALFLCGWPVLWIVLALVFHYWKW